MTAGVLLSLFLAVTISRVYVNGICDDGSVRLTESNWTEHPDLLEVCKNDTWNVVCDYNGMWTNEDAAVVCRQLGYLAMGAQGYQFPVEISPPQGVVIDCEGSEGMVTDCMVMENNGTECLGVGANCQSDVPETFRVLRMCFISSMENIQEESVITKGTSSVAAEIALMLQQDCSCSYSAQNITVAPVICTTSPTPTLGLTISVVYNTPFQETIQRLQESALSGQLQEEIVTGMEFLAMDQCSESCLTTRPDTPVPTQTTPPVQTKAFPTQIHVADNTSTPNTHSSISKATRIGLAAGLVTASVALVSVTVVTLIGVFIKFKGGWQKDRVMECHHQDGIVKPKKVAIGDSVTNLAEVCGREPETAIQPCVQSSPERTNSNIAELYTENDCDSLSRHPTAPVHHYETIGDPESPKDFTTNGEDSPTLQTSEKSYQSTIVLEPIQNIRPRIQVSPYRVSIIPFFDEQNTTPEPSQASLSGSRTSVSHMSFENSDLSSPTTHLALESNTGARSPNYAPNGSRSPVLHVPPVEGYSTLETSPSSYATLEPFIHCETELQTLHSEEYSHLVHY